MDEEDGMGWSDERSVNNWPSLRTSWWRMKRIRYYSNGSLSLSISSNGWHTIWANTVKMFQNSTTVWSLVGMSLTSTISSLERKLSLSSPTVITLLRYYLIAISANASLLGAKNPCQAKGITPFGSDKKRGKFIICFIRNLILGWFYMTQKANLKFSLPFVEIKIYLQISIGF